MSGSATPNLDLEYLDANQAQPEVKINDAWNKLDAFAGETGLGGNSLEVEQLGDSPGKKGVRKIVFDGATVTAETDDVALVTIAGGSLAVEESGGESPGATVTDVERLRFSGATVEAESDGTALVTIQAASTSLTVEEEGGESPGAEVISVERIRFIGATVEEASGGTALVTIPASGIAVECLETDATVTGVAVLRFSGVHIVEESDGVAEIQITKLHVLDESGDSDSLNQSVASIQFKGATVSSESNDRALVSVPPAPIRATFTNAFGAILAGVADIPVFCPESGTIKRATVLTDGGTSSCVVGVWKKALGSGYPPASGNDVTGGANVSVSAATTHDDSTLSGWTTTVTAGDVILFHLVSNVAFTLISITLTLG